MAQAWIYILKCSDDSHYTGHTTNIIERIILHNTGRGSTWTRDRLPIQLVYLRRFSSKRQAYQAEKQIKRWSRAKKEALIKNEIDLLKYLAKKPIFRKEKPG